MLICYDVEFPENVRRLAMAGAELVLVPTANMVPYDFVCDVLVRTRAYEPVLPRLRQLLRRRGAIRYCGLSSLNGPDGEQTARAGRDETLLLADLAHEALQTSRAAIAYLHDRRPELYRP